MTRPKRSVRPLESAGEGGTLYCAHPSRRDPSRPCGGWIGAPALGSALLSVLDLPPGETLDRLERGLWAWPCSGCGRVYVWRQAA